MVHKKYIRKGKRVFGPYLYKTKRVNGRVVTEYVGKADRRRENNSNFLNYVAIALVAVTLLLFLLMQADNFASLLRQQSIFGEGQGPFGSGSEDVLLQPAGGGIPIFGCQTLDLLDGVYELQNNIVNFAGSSCFTINDNNITLDGNGFFVDGTGGASQKGIDNVAQRYEMTIKNINITQFGLSYDAHSNGCPPGNVVVVNSSLDSIDVHFVANICGGNPLPPIMREGKVDLFNSSVREIYAYTTDSSLDGGNVTINNDFINLDNAVINVSNYTSGPALPGILKLNFTDGFRDAGADYGDSIRLRIINRSAGEIDWSYRGAIASDSLTNMGANIEISDNFVFVNSLALPALNRPALIILYNNPGQGFSNPAILRDGAPCPDCYNFTPLNAQTVIFNVTGFSAYSIGEASAVLDNTSPNINFTNPTPANGSIIFGTDIFVNVSSNDTNDHYTFVDFNKDLLLWMRFDDVNASGDPVDLSSFSRNGSLRNGAFINSTGKFGNSSNFDRVNDYIQTSSGELRTANNLTIAVWFKAGSTAWPAHHIVWQGDAFGDGGGPEEELGLSIGRPAGGSGDSLNFFIEGTNNDIDITSSGFTDTTNWHFLAATASGLNTATPSGRLFLDGVSVGTDTADTITRTFWNTNLRIGRPGANFRFMNGSVDDILIFNRSLSAAEILVLYNASANKYFNNFTGLNAGTYRFTGYAVDIAGNKNQTEERVVTLTSVAPPIQVNSCGLLSIPNRRYIQVQDIFPPGPGVCLNVTAQNISFDGNGFWISNPNLQVAGIYSNQYNTTIKNANITMSSLGSGFPPSSGGFGIQLVGATNGLIVNNTANDNYAGIYLQSGSNGNQIIDNTANSGIIGIQTATASQSNYINGNRADSNSYGMLIYSSFNELRDNVMDSNGAISLLFSNNADNNLVVNNSLLNNGAFDDGALYFFTARHNRVINTTINNSLNHAIFFWDVNTNNNSFANVVVSNTASNQYDIRFNAAGINDTRLIDTKLANYSFTGVGGRVVFEDTGEGELRFLRPINGSGLNLSDDVRIKGNFVAVESGSNAGLNVSANVTLYNMPGGFSNPAILRNGATCPGGICHNFTDLNAGTVIFNVTGFTNYSIGEGSVSAPDCSAGPIVLDVPNTVFVLEQNMITTGDCFIIEADNVTLDGNGFYIKGDGGVTDDGVRVDVIGSIVMNAVVRNMNISTFGRGIILSEAFNSVINNNFIHNSSRFGIEVASINIQVPNYNNITNNIITNTSGEGMLVLISSFNKLENNIIRSSGGPLSGTGIQLQSNASYNYLLNNTVDITSQEGLAILLSENNYISNMKIRNSGEHGIYLWGPDSATGYRTHNNTFVNVSVENTAPLFYDIYFNSSVNHFINNTRLIDTHLGAYRFADAGNLVIFEDTGEGEIRFLRPINGSGLNLSNDVRIKSNFVAVESASNAGLNVSANITLYNMPGGFSDPAVLRDGMTCGGICYNFTDLNAGTVVFNVSYWTNYSIGGDTNFVGVVLSPVLASVINWSGIGITGVNDVPAIGNNDGGTGITYYNVTIQAQGTTADLYIFADDDLMTAGGARIGIANESFRFSLTDSSVPAIGPERDLSIAAQLVASGLSDGAVVHFKFYLDVPFSQGAGVYNNSILFRAVGS